MTDQNPQRFSTFIAEHRAGLADADLTSAMQEVAHRCALTAGGKLTLGVIIDRLDDVLADAVAGEVDRIRAEFPGVPVVYGTPG